MAKDKKGNDESSVMIEHIPRGGNEVGGDLRMSKDVVATIAGIAARKIAGVHSLGKSRLITFGDSPTWGIEAEVGSKEAALDVDIIIEYGCNLREVSNRLRAEIAQQVDMMAGRKVVEVNINVVGIHIEEDKPPAPTPARRVE